MSQDLQVPQQSKSLIFIFPSSKKYISRFCDLPNIPRKVVSCKKQMTTHKLNFQTQKKFIDYKTGFVFAQSRTQTDRESGETNIIEGQ